MRRTLFVLLLAVLMLLTLAPAGSADVHGVSQANCAADGVESGAIRSRDAEGRPGAPIPVTASGGRHEGQGGAAPAAGVNC